MYYTRSLTLRFSYLPSLREKWSRKESEEEEEPEDSGVRDEDERVQIQKWGQILKRPMVRVRRGKMDQPSISLQPHGMSFLSI